MYTTLRTSRLTEFNVVVKKKFELNIALTYPSTYQSSLSSLGFQTVYYLLNQQDEVYAERVVSTGAHTARSIERGTPLRRFPVILASLSYELDYPNFINILRQSNIPIKRLERGEEDPLIIAGGAAVTGNPSPLHQVVDAVVRGESEEIIPELATVLLESQGLPKKTVLENLSRIEGVWIPDLKENTGIRITRDLDSAFHPVRQIQNPRVEPVFGRAMMVEPIRGCARGCSFCMEASITRLRRERSMETVIRLISDGIRVNSVSRVAFYTLSFFDSSLGERLLEYLVEEGIEASIPSVRADALNEKRVSLVKAVGQKTLTIAPETPVFRLQRVLRKHISDDKVLEVADYVSRLGMSLKLYYMVGVPGESDEDLRAIVEQVRKIRDIMGDKRRIKVSVNPFIPKPETLLWGNRMEDKRTLKRKLFFLKRELAKHVGRVDVYPLNLAVFQYEVNRMGKNSLQLILSLADKWNYAESFNNHGDRGVEVFG